MGVSVRFSERSPTVSDIGWLSRVFFPSGLTIFNYRWVIHFIFPRQPARQVFTDYYEQCMFEINEIIRQVQIVRDDLLYFFRIRW